MKLVLCVAFALFAAAAADVLVLTDDNFDDFIDGSTPAFIKFYAPWCGHCKKLAPAYEVVGSAFRRFKDQAIVAKVDCDANPDVCSRFEVRGYPTLKWFPEGGEPEPYSGAREAEDIIQFINSKAGTRAKAPRAGGPSALVDLTDSSFEEVVLDENKHVFVEFYAPWCGHCKNLEPDYISFAEAFANEEDVVIARIDADQHKEQAGKYGVTGFPTLKWFPKGDKSGEAYTGGRSLEDLVSYVNSRADKFRTTGGELTEEAGRIIQLDDIADGFAEASNKDRLLEKAKEEAAALTGGEARLGKMYVRAMEKIAAGETDYVEKEIARLNRMMQSSSLKPTKEDEFQMRINILRQFA